MREAMVKEGPERLLSQLVLLRIKRRAENKKAEDQTSAFFNIQN